MGGYVAKSSGTSTGYHADMFGGRAAPIAVIIYFPVNKNFKILE
jgi:hypothetical protein